jgi:hypothetical protein
LSERRILVSKRDSRDPKPAWWVRLGATIDGNDLVTSAGVISLVEGLRRISPVYALIAFGLICIWYGLPTRPPFIDSRGQ